MAASAYGFRTGRIGIIQSLLAKPYADGRVELPRTREDLYLRPSRPEDDSSLGHHQLLSAD
jgi:hypothetical protein